MAVVHLIAALGSNGEIGKDGGLPWSRMKADMHRFKQLTMGNVLVMGRKTWDSLPRKTGTLPLPGRTVCVVSRSVPSEGCAHVCGSLPDAMAWAQTICDMTGPLRPSVFIAGGASIYGETIDKVDHLHLTLITAAFPGSDTFFPQHWHVEAFKSRLRTKEIVPADTDNEHGSVYLHFQRNYRL